VLGASGHVAEPEPPGTRNGSGAVGLIFYVLCTGVPSLYGTYSCALHCRCQTSPRSSSPCGLHWMGVVGSSPESAPMARSSPCNRWIWALSHQIRPSHAPPPRAAPSTFISVSSMTCSPMPLWEAPESAVVPSVHATRRTGALNSWCCRFGALFTHPRHRRAEASSGHQRTLVLLIPCVGAKPPPAALVAFVDLLPT
jgi:hypothetical protein